jgi:hypothetical protein
MPDNRETAALIWLAIIFVWIASKKDLRASVGGVFRTAMHPKILLAIIVMCGYVGLEVSLASKFALWRLDLVKPTLLWLAAAFAMLLHFDQSVKEPHFYRRAVVETFGVAALLSFFINVAVMSMPVELATQPIIAVLGMLSVFAGHSDEHRRAKKIVDVLLALIGFLLAGYTACELYFTWHQIDTRGLLLQLALPVWLTIGYLPFIYLFSLIANYGMAFAGINWATKDRRARWRAKAALITKFHFRARGTHGFSWMVAKQLADAPTLSAARAVIADFQKSRQQVQQKDPQPESVDHRSFVNDHDGALAILVPRTSTGRAKA